MYNIVYMDCAYAFAKLSKCIRLKVGAVIVKDNHIISHGYNGTAAGQPNCCDIHTRALMPHWYDIRHFQLTEEGKLEHHIFSSEHEIHAEMNAILFAAKNGLSIHGSTMYCTTAPCSDCIKNISQAGISAIIYDKEYYKNSSDWKEKLLRNNIVVKHTSEI